VKEVGILDHNSVYVCLCALSVSEIISLFHRIWY